MVRNLCSQRRHHYGLALGARMQTMKRTELKPLLARLRLHATIIGKQRDELRLLYEEIERILEPTERGVQALEEAIDSISEVM
jgi:hypothetical protein